METTTSIFLIILFAVLNIGIVQVGINWIQSIARNPTAAEQIFTPAVIVLGMLEVSNLVAIGMTAYALIFS